MSPIRDTIILLRIPFSVYLMPVFFFALSQLPEVDDLKAVVVFAVLHLLVYPASNGYNSYMDQDTGSIGGIEHPPLPPKALFPVTLTMDLVAILVSLWIVGWVFAGMVLTYILASRAYSYRGIRLKKYPILGFLTVFIFQGGFTFAMVCIGCSVDSVKIVEFLATPLLYPVLVASFMLGGGYPLTQIYQHEADRESGDTSFSMLLGIRGTFIFSIVMFAIVNLLFFMYFWPGNMLYFYLFQLFLLPVVGWFFIWMKKTWANPQEAGFRNMMRMNNLSAVCMNGFFILLFALNHIV